MSTEITASDKDSQTVKSLSIGSDDQAIANAFANFALSDAAVQDVRPRTGTTFAGFCQVVTAVVGAGILALPSAFAALGWIAGILLLLAFAIITYAATLLLIDCCETDGVRHPTYYYAVKAAFPKSRWPRVGLQIVQQTNLVLTGLGYAITAGKALQKTWPWVFVFSAIEVLICQLRTMEELTWVSVIGAISSLGYSVIAMYFGFAYWGTNPGTIGGAYTTAPAKIWSIFNALGTIAFSYNFFSVAVEITDTIQEPFKVKMKHSLTAAVPSMTALFLLVAVPNYEAMGDNIAGYLFDSYSSPKVPIVIANLLVVIHLAGAYAMYTAPVFYLVETSMTRATKMSNNAAVAFRVIWRVSYVAIIGLLGALMPFFNAFVGLVGGITFWPLAVGLPIAMWSSRHKPDFWTRMALQTVSAVCLVISLLAVIGSIEGIVVGLSTFSIGL